MSFVGKTQRRLIDFVILFHNGFVVGAYLGYLPDDKTCVKLAYAYEVEV